MAGVKDLDGVDFASQKGTNAADPTNPQDVATKNYVDAAVPAITPTVDYVVARALWR